jgi:hypothetical protein
MKLLSIKYLKTCMLMLILIACSDKQDKSIYAYDPLYRDVMADMIVANKLYAKTLFKNRDSTMQAILLQITQIHSANLESFEAYMENLQNSEADYKIFMDSVQAKLDSLNVKFSQPQ